MTELIDLMERLADELEGVKPQIGDYFWKKYGLDDLIEETRNTITTHREEEA